MSDPCNKKNPLTRSGTHQDERYLDALDPASIPVDERSIADLALFARRFGAHIKYRDRNNAEQPGKETWSPFFSTDITAIFAGLSSLEVSTYLTFYRGLQQYLADEPGRDPGDLSAHFKLLFHLPLLLLKAAGDYFDLLGKTEPMRGFMEEVVSRDVETPLKDLIAYYKGATTASSPVFSDSPLAPADYNTTFDSTNPRIQLPSAVTERIDTGSALSALPVSDELLESIAPAGWGALFGSVAADPSPYEASAGDVYEQIYDALNFNLINHAFDRLFQAVARFVEEAGDRLDATLTEVDTHTPHYGLWLAFIQLVGHHQEHINTLTERHLNYYYKEVLQLSLQEAEPDKVHLLFALNKNKLAHKLPAGTQFKAGKDGDGKPVVYELDEDFIINRATVDSLKSLHRPSFSLFGIDIYAPWSSGVTNSKDGEGEELPKDDKQWAPFGPISGLPDAQIGFAVADRQLFMREGNRIIGIEVTPENPLPPGVFSLGFQASLTAEEGWFDVSDASKLFVVKAASTQLWFFIVLDGEDPAVVPYDEEVHGKGFATSEPVLKLRFDFANHPLWGILFFSYLKDLRFTSVKLQVSGRDQRNFTLQGDTGLLDTSKPFQPFGASPAAGSSLILGSSELFSKRLEDLKLNITWAEALTGSGYLKPDAPNTYEVSTRHLQNGTWKSFGSSHDLFVDGGKTKQLDLDGLDALSTSLKQTLENPGYGPDSAAGFVRLDLNKDFAHSAYASEQTLALIEIAKYGTRTSSSYNYDSDTNLPKEPYTPTIAEIDCFYKTKLETPGKLYHLHPFGHTKEDAGSGRLFPATDNEGELYIGVKDLDPPERLSMLFQTVDGSANPLKPENTLAWHYLKGDTWVTLEPQDVDDKTNNLTGSGIIGIAVPADADTQHSILPSDTYWFRMSVQQDADALNNILSIDAQAATASFVDQNNDTDFLATPLSAETISKLKQSDGAVKKIKQPYASFGGRTEESEDDFYERVSERLRHKDRACTMWDYEHLVLEHFPKVYKVKCINHTKLCRDSANNVLADNEVRPGHVLVVPIPYVEPDGAVDPLRPYVDKKTLVAVDRFLRKRISPFVTLEVQNPRIEEVQVSFNVAFTEDVADISFYKDELKNAIVEYLTPWSYESGAEISFGGKWHKSAIIDFVEEQSYVDYVKDFEMYHKADIGQADWAWNRVDEEVVEATTSRSILVSHASHTIQEIT